MRPSVIRVWCGRVAAALVALGLLVLLPSPAAADEPSVEVGTTMASLLAGVGDNDTTLLGVPPINAGFGNPGIYTSLFVTPHVAIEPQLGLVWQSTGGRSSHLLTLNGQVDYFVDGLRRSSAFVFGSVGVTDGSGSSNPKNLGFGVGYRIPVASRLAFRLDAGFQHYTDGIGNLVALHLSIGGIFGSN